MKKYILVCLVAGILCAFGCRKDQAHPYGQQSTISAQANEQNFSSPEPKIGEYAICPINKSKFSIKPDSHYIVFNGKKYYTCCGDCYAELKSNPEKYLKK